MTIQRISPEDVQRKLEAGDSVAFVDVREPSEHALCRIGDGLLIPLGELSRRSDEVEVEEGALIVVYCHHGVRSLRGAAILQMAGMKNVASMDGGIDAWSLRIDSAIPRY